MGILSLVRAQLIVALLVCPYICVSGGTLLASDDAQATEALCCHGDSQNHDQPNGPCEEGKGSDCLCHGAVADTGQASHGSCDLPPAPGVGRELPTLARHQSQVARGTAALLDRASPPAFGRRLRALIASLLI